MTQNSRCAENHLTSVKPNHGYLFYCTNFGDLVMSIKKLKLKMNRSLGYLSLDDTGKFPPALLVCDHNCLAVASGAFQCLFLGSGVLILSCGETSSACK